MQVSRSDRVGEEVKHAVSEILREELKDPGITSMVSVVRAEVTRDFRYAKIHVSLYGSETQQEETLAALKRAAGFVRRELGKRVRLHYTPEVLFVPDRNIEYGAHMSQLIDSVRRQEEEEGQPDA